MMVFSKEWFLEHQKKLLWLANTYLGKRLFRIHKDCPRGRRIIKLLPNCYTWDNEDGTVSTDFRTHDKFAKRLYYGLKPLWYALHFWDWLFADRYYPELSFEFDTLTAYPAAGAVSPCDGYVVRSGVNETFTGIRSGAGTSAVNSISDFITSLYGSTTSNQYERIRRAIYMFDTSSTPDEAVIRTGVFSIFGTGKVNTLSLSDSHGGCGIGSVNPAATNDLVAADYNIANWGSDRYATDIGYAAWSITSYNDFTFNATGIAAISKTGITKIGARSAVDIDNGTPNWVSSGQYRLQGDYADQTGTSQDPKLVVTYSATHEILVNIDSLLNKADITKTLSSDGFLQKEFTKTVSGDGLLQKEFTQAVNSDGLLNKIDIPKTVNSDGLLNKIDIARTLLIDAILAMGTNIDALLQKLNIIKTLGIDALLIKGWQASTAYSLGDKVNPAATNGYYYKCTTAGTSGGTEPTWPTANGGTVSDGTVVWTGYQEQVFNNTGIYSDPTYGRLLRVTHAGGISGTYTSPVYDRGSSLTRRSWPQYDYLFFGTGTAWWDQFTTTQLWTDKFGASDSWLTLFGAYIAGILKIRFAVSTNGTTWTWFDNFESYVIEAQGRYIKYEITITDVETAGYLTLKPLTYKEAYWQ